jgi:uncharacterized protein (DUF488 family)
MAPIYSIGHSTRTLEELVALIREFSIEVLADIRSFPASARHPQFNKENLEQALPAVGIEYQWLGKELGGFRKKAGVDSPHTALRSPSFRNYADYMATAEFRAGIDRLLALAATKRLAYMCAEVLWWRCHRSLVSDYLTACRGAEVIHILGPGKSEPHRLHRTARLTDGKLIYDVGGQQTSV